MRSLFAVAVFGLSLGVLALPAAASGTSGTSGSGYSRGLSTPESTADPAAEAYSRGKSMVAKRIACKKCPLPQGVKDTPTAQAVAARVKAGEFELSASERGQVLYYLSRRFGA